MSSAASFAPAAIGTESPCLQDRSADSVNPSADADTSRRTELTRPFSDDDREAAIKRAGAALEKHMAQWEETGCFAARGDADRARRLMELLIAGRSAEQVAKMERERGLS